MDKKLLFDYSISAQSYGVFLNYATFLKKKVSKCIKNVE